MRGCQQEQAAAVLANPNADDGCDVAMLDEGGTERSLCWSSIVG
jgi:hypothetical protein